MNNEFSFSAASSLLLQMVPTHPHLDHSLVLQARDSFRVLFIGKKPFFFLLWRIKGQMKLSNIAFLRNDRFQIFSSSGWRKELHPLGLGLSGRTGRLCLKGGGVGKRGAEPQGGGNWD